MVSFAFIGFGELATAFSRGLSDAGVEDIRAYSRPHREPVAARALEERLRTGSARLCASLHDTVHGATAIVAAVPASSAVAAVSECLHSIDEGCIYVDPAPLAPSAKEESAALIGSRGGLYVDAAVLGTVALDGSRVPTLVAGPGAAAWRDLVMPLGMNVSLVEGPAGRASLVKLLRSVYMKGRDALILEMLVASRHYGLEQTILESIRGSGEQVPFPALASRVMCSLALHADRRADELAASAEVVRGAAVEPIVTSAGSERLRRVAELGLRDHFGRERPQHLADVLAAIDALAERGAML